MEYLSKFFILRKLMVIKRSLAIIVIESLDRVTNLNHIRFNNK